MLQTRCARFVGSVALATLVATGGHDVDAQGAPNSQPNPYQQPIEEPLALPDGREMGWVMGVEVDRTGNVWILDTCGGGFQDCVGSTEPLVLKFDASGSFVSSFGGGMVVHPHGLYIDDDGYVWVLDGFGGNAEQTDQGHQVHKFSPEGELLMSLGTAGVRGDGPATFNTPSDVLVAPNGDIFVADGHGGDDMNDRIVRFTADGTFAAAWGTKGSGPGQFGSTHSLAMDSQGRLFVGDRGNNRIQIFDQEGMFLDEWRQFGSPSELFIDEDDELYVADSTSNESNNPGYDRGIRIGSARDGTVASFVPDPEPGGAQELVVVAPDGAMYTGYTLGRSVKKYIEK
jgi:hypothetical protein